MQVALQRLFRCYKTATEMMNDRDYEIDSTRKFTNFESFRRHFIVSEREGLNFSCVHRETQKKCCVYFEHTVKNLRFLAIHSDVVTQGAKHAIIIHNQKLPYTIKHLQAKQTNFRYEFFIERNLTFNITKHVLVPAHIKLTPKEKKALLSFHKLTESKLPRIMRSDPVARYYGLCVGDVVRIIRIDEETKEKSVSYRVCMEK